MTITKEEYQCSVCKNTYTKGWSEEEALAEYGENFLFEGEDILISKK